MSENMLTINKLAEKLGVSRPTIYNNVPENMSFTKVDGVNYIDEDLEKVITDKINERRKSSKSIDKQSSNNNSELIESLNNELIYLKKQLETKDQQLNNKDEQIKQYSKLLENQQLLALQSNQKVEQLENEIKQIELKETEEDNRNNDLESESEQQLQNDTSNTKKEKASSVSCLVANDGYIKFYIIS
ncbi:DUF536 domain-containing protein (plasmid) [Staphylococcus epidermidis]|nr:DUF536 domain-containing protein [Staphylococcus epidermidis]UTP75749.1 DUF536 domain-containing protein [Staphylococcus epidermidis]